MANSDLSPAEINKVLSKIRTKYDDLILKFKKGPSLRDAFEQRYIQSLKKRVNISIFLIAEIEAVNEMYEKAEKQYEEEIYKRKLQKKEVRSFADQIFDENNKKIDKYPSMTIHKDADIQIVKLFGAIRDWINRYWSIALFLFSDNNQESISQKIKEYDNKLFELFDYKGNVPLGKNYVSQLEKVNKDNKRIDFEYQYILKESGFLLNEILAFLSLIIDEPTVLSNYNKKLVIQPGDISNFFYDLSIFKNFTRFQTLIEVQKTLKYVIEDFRIKDFKKSSS